MIEYPDRSPFPNESTPAGVGRQDARAHHVLELYVTGMSPGSTAAISLVKATCDDLLSGRYELEVIDIYQAPGRARAEHVVAAPTLVRQLPLPVRRVVGNLSSRARVMQALSLERGE
jgi:circadian clock protein KaiB